MKRTILFLLALLFLATGCENKLDYDLEGFEPKLIVEAWIEEDGLPYVLLTRNWPLSAEIDTYTVSNNIVRWAKVSVKDGETEDVLTGRRDDRFFPPFIYRSNLLSGKAGHTYTLIIENDGKVYRAQTTIPARVRATEFLFSDDPEVDSLYRLKVRIDDPPVKNYYKIYTCVLNKEKKFSQAFTGNIDDNLFESSGPILPVNRGAVSFPLKASVFETRFNKADTILVKLCTQTEAGFRFWSAYENELINGQNPLFPANKNLPGNLSEGAGGIWCGYGTRIYRVVYGVGEPDIYTGILDYSAGMSGTIR